MSPQLKPADPEPAYPGLKSGSPGDAGIPGEVAFCAASSDHAWPPSSHQSPTLCPPPSWARAGKNRASASGLLQLQTFRTLSPFCVLCVPLSGWFPFQQSEGFTEGFTQATVSPPFLEVNPCRVARAGAPEHQPPGTLEEDGQEPLKPAPTPLSKTGHLIKDWSKQQGPW